MKILFLSRTFYPEIFGGGEVSAKYIARSVSKFADVCVCTLSEKITRPVIEYDGKVKIYRFPWRKYKMFPRISNLELCYVQLLSAAKKVARIESPDVIHMLNFASYYPLAFFFRKYPKFATCNGPWFCAFGGYHDERGCYRCTFKEKITNAARTWGWKFIPFLAYTNISQFLLARSLIRFNSVLPVSNAMKKMLLENGIPEDKIDIVHNPTPVNRVTSTDLKHKLGIHGKMILFTGRLTQDKGVQHTIRALRLLPGFSLVVVGKGKYLEELRRIAQTENVGDRVFFEGFKDESVLKDYYSSADVVVYSGEVYEALPRMILDAMSYGIPIVARNVGGTSDLIEDGSNGFLLDDMTPDRIAGAVRKIFSDKKIYERFRTNSLRKVRNGFSMDVIGRRLLGLYESAARKGLSS